MAGTIANSAASEAAGYCVGDLRIDIATQQVTRGGEEIALPRLSFDFLLALARAAPAVVSVDALMERVWPGLVVSPETVNQRLKLVRQALGDDPRSPRYIAVVRGRGYRLVAPVTPLSSPRSAREEVDAGDLQRLGIIGGDPRRIGRIDTRRLKVFGAAAGLALLVAGAGLYWLVRSESGRSVPRTSIAVLPFANVGGDPADLYLSDGLADELRDRLARVGGLRVVARTSSMAVQGQGLDAPAIAGKLGVAALVEGSVRREGERLRISVELISGRDGYRLWSESYDREHSDLLTIQQEVATAVVTAMLPSFLEGGGNVPEAATTNVSAFDLLLLARSFARARDEPAERRGIELLKQALLLDPTFAQAEAELAQMWLSFHDPDQARPHIERALELDPNLSQAHAARAYYLQLTEQPGVREAYEQALSLDPNNTTAMFTLALHHAWSGRLGDAIELTERAVELDPMALAPYESLVDWYAMTGQQQAARRTMRRVRELFGETVAVAHVMASAHWPVEEYVWLRRILSASPSTDALRELTWLSFRLGDESRCRQWQLAHAEQGGSPATWGGLTDSACALLRPDRQEIESVADRIAADFPEEAAFLLGLLGHHDRALQLFERAGWLPLPLDAERIYRRTFVLSAPRLMTALSRSGRQEEAMQLAEQILDYTRRGRAQGWNEGAAWHADIYVHVLFGRKELALDALERATVKAFHLAMYEIDATLGELRAEPRYIALAERLRPRQRDALARVAELDREQPWLGPWPDIAAANSGQ